MDDVAVVVVLDAKGNHREPGEDLFLAEALLHRDEAIMAGTASSWSAL